MEDFNPAEHEQMHREWVTWRRACAELDALGIDINDSAYTPFVRQIEAWGEELAALRALQDPAKVDEWRAEKVKAAEVYMTQAALKIQ